MKHPALQELDTAVLHKLQHYQMSLQLILGECAHKDARIAQAEAEIADLRAREAAHAAETGRLRQEAASAEARAAGASGATERERAELAERIEAVRSVYEALIDSLRPFGFDRGRFRRAVMGLGRRVPADGPQAVRHAVLLAEARKLLEPGA